MLLSTQETHANVRRDARDEATQVVVESLHAAAATITLFWHTLDKDYSGPPSDQGLQLTMEHTLEFCQHLIHDMAREIAEAVCKNHLQFDQVENQEQLIDDVVSDIRDLARTEVIKL